MRDEGGRFPGKSGKDEKTVKKKAYSLDDTIYRVVTYHDPQ